MWKRIQRNYRRLVASLLTLVMVATNVGGNLGTVFASGETENALFLVDREELREAIQEAEEQGEVFDFSALHMAAKRKSIKTRYEKLLGKKEGAVYALNLEIDDSYAPEGTELQVFYNAGTEDVIFLFLNGSDLVVDYRVNIDGYETEPVRVNPNTANIEADGEDAPVYAENYEAADMIDDEGKKLEAEVLNPTEMSGEDETEAGEEESKGDISGEETGDEVTETKDPTGDDSQKETDESDASTGTAADDENEEENDAAEKETPDVKEEGEDESEASEAETEAEDLEETEAETEAEEEKAEETEEEAAEPETEAASDDEADADDGELLSISRHEAAIVTISVDELEDREAEVEEEAEIIEETEDEKEAEISETEDETEALEAEDETEASEAEDEAEASGAEDKTEASEAEDETGASGAEDETAASGAEDGTEASEADKGTEGSGAENETGASGAEDKTEASEADKETGDPETETNTDIESETETDAADKEDIKIEEIDKDSSIEAPDGADSDINIGEDPIDMEGQLLEDGDIEILGELKGKEYDTVTILDHVNAKALKIAWEDIEAIITSDAEDVEYAVNYTVNLPEGASVKGADTVAEGKDLYFAVDLEDGYEIQSVLVNGVEAEELDPESDLASASDWKDDSYAYVVSAVSEDLDIEIEVEEIISVIPAVTYEAETEDAVIVVDVPEGAFEEEVEFRAEKIQEESLLQELTSQAEEAIEEGRTVEGVLAYDLTFVTKSEEEVEPGKPVDVKISFKENAIPEEVAGNATAVSVVHLPEGEAAEIEATVESTAVEELNFQAESFSVRMAVFTREAGEFGPEWKRAYNAETLHSAFTSTENEVKIYLDSDIVTELKRNEAGKIISDEGWSIPKGKKFILDLHGHTLTYGGKGEDRARLFFVRGDLTIRNSSDKQGIVTHSKEKIDGLIYVGGGTLTLEGGSISPEGHSNNHGIVIGTDRTTENNYNYKDPNSAGGTFNMTGGSITGNGSPDEDGGGVYVHKGIVNIKGGSLEGNTGNNGGGIYACAGTTINISGGIISGNKSEKYDSRGAFFGEGSGGGGIFTRGSMVLSGGKISGNTAKGGGGGIYVDTDFKKYPKFSMEGGTIEGNTAADEGGGIYFGWNGTITGGSIIKNETTTDIDWGGGGIFIQNGATVDIFNALITENHADGFGGGVAGCPSGDVRAFTINGAAIFGNTAKGEKITQRVPADGKIEDQDAKKDTVFLDNGYRDYYCEHFSTVYGKMLGGGSAEWRGSAKQEDSPTKPIFIGRDDRQTATDRMGLNANPDDESKQDAWSSAKVIFSDNSSTTHGGAIMCNGTLNMGMEENTEEKIEISGQKTWNDDNNRDGERPESIVVQLFANGSQVDSKTVTPDATGNWKWTFKNLAKEAGGKPIIYTIKEKEVAGSEYTAVVNKYNITNTYTPKKVSISGEKTWDDHNDQDGKRPESITVVLLKNGIKTEQKKTIQADNQGKWQWTFDDLYQYENGQEITYTVQEEKIPEGYESIVDGTNITNKHEPAKIDIPGQKTWDDENNRDGKRPKSITVDLYADGKKVDSKEVTEADGWSWTFVDKPKYKEGEVGVEIQYTIQESVVKDYSTGYVENSYDITNRYTPGRTSRKVQKIWIDSNDQDGIRPTSIQVQLMANGVAEGEPVTLTPETNWSHTWDGLYEKADGQDIKYTVVELGEITGYTTAYSEDTFIITNTHKPAEVKHTVKKVWEDADNQDGIRPESIQVQLLADGQATGGTILLSAENEWSYTWENLPERANGQAIRYTVAEVGMIEGYTASYSEDTFTITNTHKPAEVSHTVRKIWNDADNRDRLRPESIQVQLMADGQVEGEAVILSAENEWSYTWNHLPEKANGQNIRYTVAELGEIPGYTVTYSEDTFTITNTHTTPNRPGGGGGGGNPGGGGSSPGGPGAGTTTIDEPGVPLANLPAESVNELIEESEVPLAALPKTGDSRHTRALLMMFGIAGLGMLLTAAGLRKRKDDSEG
jgi:predicted outer membrane repeat protein